jgi:hypothetical protein
MRTATIVLFLSLTLPAACVPGCARPASTTAAPATPAAVARPADLDPLLGPGWTGTLTYLDYSSGKPTSIASTFELSPATPSADGGRAWPTRIAYPQEPNANSTGTLTLNAGGTALGEPDQPATIIERTPQPDGSLRLVTQQRGEDNRQPATIRKVYSIAPKAFSITKFVRFDNQNEFFERHTYRWTR